MKKHPVQKSPTTEPMQLLDGMPGRAATIIQNAGTVRVYLGRDDTVSTGSSLYLDAGGVLSEAGPGCSDDDWWGITESGTADLRIVQVI
jgi:hypothetical protein